MSGEPQQVSEVPETDKDYKLNQISQELKDNIIINRVRHFELMCSWK